jgi:hypothetical protein
MLTTHHVEAGKYYIREDEHNALQVLELAGQMATYSIYDLGSGCLCGAPYRLCTTLEIIDWADREATSEETEQLKNH